MRGFTKLPILGPFRTSSFHGFAVRVLDVSLGLEGGVAHLRPSDSLDTQTAELAVHSDVMRSPSLLQQLIPIALSHIPEAKTV